LLPAGLPAGQQGNMPSGSAMFSWLVLCVTTIRQ